MIPRTLLAFLLLPALITSSAVADDVDDYVQKLLTETKVPAVSIAVVRTGHVVKAKGYGLADVELAAPASEKTVYQWASVTKQFTAVAILLLAEDGKLKLDDPVSAHYPAAPKTWKDVTIRHLLNHTSGIRSMTDLREFRKTLRTDYSPDEMIGMVKEMDLDFEPGERWHYNNTGYFLLGLIIEKAGGQSYGDFLQSRIFQPLGMTTARLNDQMDLIPNRATGYYVVSNEVKRAVFVSPSQPFSAGALVGTVLDLAKWDATLYSDKLLPAKVRDAMWQPTKLNNGKTHPYGYGWQLGKVRGHRYVGHGGGIDGFQTFILRLVDDKLTVIVLENGNGRSPQTVAESIAARYLPELSLASIKPGPDPDPELSGKLRKALFELSETKDSEILTESFRRNFSNSRRRHGMLKEDVKELKNFTFLLAETPEPEGRERTDVITRLLTYKVQTDRGLRYYTFGLTADKKLANINVAEE